MRHHHLFPGYELLQCLRWVGKVSVHGHGHGLQAFSVEYLSGQCYKRDREGQRLDQSLFSDSQATESQGKETRKHWWVEQRAEDPGAEGSILKPSVHEGGSQITAFPSTWNVTALVLPQNSSTRLRFQLMTSLWLADVIHREICCQLSKDAIRINNFRSLGDDGSDVIGKWQHSVNRLNFYGNVLWVVTVKSLPTMR